jgi:hypothetical protein
LEVCLRFGGFWHNGRKCGLTTGAKRRPTDSFRSIGNGQKREVLSFFARSIQHAWTF